MCVCVSNYRIKIIIHIAMACHGDTNTSIHIKCTPALAMSFRLGDHGRSRKVQKPHCAERRQLWQDLAKPTKLRRRSDKNRLFPFLQPG